MMWQILPEEVGDFDGWCELSQIGGTDTSSYTTCSTILSATTTVVVLLFCLLIPQTGRKGL